MFRKTAHVVTLLESSWKIVVTIVTIRCLSCSATAKQDAATRRQQRHLDDKGCPQLQAVQHQIVLPTCQQFVIVCWSRLFLKKCCLLHSNAAQLPGSCFANKALQYGSHGSVFEGVGQKWTAAHLKADDIGDCIKGERGSGD